MIAPAEPVAAPIPTPTADNSADEIRKAQEAELERLKKQKGRAATILNEGGEEQGISVKKMLGS